MSHVKALDITAAIQGKMVWFILLQLKFQYFGGMKGWAVTVGGTGMKEENVTAIYSLSKTTFPHRVEGTQALYTPMFRLIITLPGLSSEGATKFWG